MVLLLGLPCAAATAATDLTGVWQGDPTHVLELTHKNGGGWGGEIHYLGEAGAAP